MCFQQRELLLKTRVTERHALLRRMTGQSPYGNSEGQTMDWLENIKKIKKNKGFTNESLSEKSGISIGTLNKLLCGATSDPKLSTLLSLSDALDCSLDALIGIRKEPSSALGKELLLRYEALDAAGRKAVDDVANREYERMIREQAEEPYSLDTPSVRKLRLYNIAVSAGTGSYLSGDDYREISVYSNEKTDAADFAVRVYGDSMMPRYADGDILLVMKSDGIEKGELGIFALNGESFFKKYGGDRLISLNPAYRDIVIGENDEILCFGKVIGRLKK